MKIIKYEQYFRLQVNKHQFLKHLVTEELFVEEETIGIQTIPESSHDHLKQQCLYKVILMKFQNF